MTKALIANEISDVSVSTFNISDLPHSNDTILCYWISILHYSAIEIRCLYMTMSNVRIDDIETNQSDLQSDNRKEFPLISHVSTMNAGVADPDCNSSKCVLEQDNTIFDPRNKKHISVRCRLAIRWVCHLTRFLKLLRRTTLIFCTLLSLPTVISTMIYWTCKIISQLTTVVARKLNNLTKKLFNTNKASFCAWWLGW